MKERAYNTFESVEELRNYYNIPINETVNEEKEEPEVATEPESEEKDPKNDKDKKAKLTVNNDKYEVHYAKLDEYNNIFKHIILFTNSKNPKDNKTLKNIFEAQKNLKRAKQPVFELHMFLAEDVKYEENPEDGSILISDSDSEFKITDDITNVNTLVFSRLGVQGEDGCEHVVKVLQDRGFLVLNPVRYSEIACNKYDSAMLFKNANIPQPNFCLMTKEILYDEKQYVDSMKEIYKNFKNDGDKDESLEFVVKILDGHGGTGVMLLNGKNILAVLQAIFAIDPERKLLIQKKEQADGGDIRVHVLTLRDKQIILAAMKRIKIKSDFRSNVSLGAEAEPVKLTPEQEQIALKTALVSQLPWCAVDIMPLVKGSNKELGDNVVLEINASPGTAGISDVMDDNFINILLSELTNPSQFYLQEKVAGYLETVKLDFGSGNVEMLAKLDTGNGTKASVVEVGKMDINDNKVSFKLFNKNYTFDIVDHSNVYVGENHKERPVIKIPQLTLGKRKVNDVLISVVEHRDGNSSNILLNRDIISYLGYVVNPNKIHILTNETEKVKII